MSRLRRDATAHVVKEPSFVSAAREAASLARHERALAQARRQAELATARAGAQPADGDADEGPTGAVNGRHSDAALIPAVITVPLPSAAAPLPEAPLLSTADTRDSPGTEVKVPATATTVAQWANTWVRMCADGELARGSLNDDEHARVHYDVSTKQLRNIRNAATSGALRRRAEELGVSLPAGYVDHPPESRVNGQALAGASV